MQGWFQNFTPREATIRWLIKRKLNDNYLNYQLIIMQSIALFVSIAGSNLLNARIFLFSLIVNEGFSFFWHFENIFTILLTLEKLNEQVMNHKIMSSPNFYICLQYHNHSAYIQINYFNNQIIVDLVEQPHKGIISILDEACLTVGNVTDTVCLNSMDSKLAQHPHYTSRKVRTDRCCSSSFISNHSTF